jgi:hypothetical protein
MLVTSRVPIPGHAEAWKRLPAATRGTGQPLPVWARALAATVQGNTLSYESEGKKRSLELSFCPQQTVKAKGEAKDDYSGVYILGQDYLCISLNAGEEDRAAHSS